MDLLIKKNQIERKAGKRRFLLEKLKLGDGRVILNGWWEICGDMLVNSVGGRHFYTPFPDDKIVEADSFDDLDHSYLVKDDSDYGWISPDGRFYGCDCWQHSELASLIFKTTEEELERKGWIKVYMDFDKRRSWYCLEFPTEYQIATLEKHGLDIDTNAQFVG